MLGRIPWTHCILSRDPYGPEKGQGHPNLVNPTPQEGLRTILGVCQLLSAVYSGLCLTYHTVTRFLQPKEPFQRSSEATQAFNTLKTCFATRPLLQYPDPQLLFMVEADASSVTLGMVLSQQNSPAQPLQSCACYSGQLTELYHLGMRTTAHQGGVRGLVALPGCWYTGESARFRFQSIQG